MEHLVTYFKANRGEQSRLAAHLGLSPSTISQWKAVPAEHVRKVAAFTGLDPAELRPDIFGPDEGPPHPQLAGARKSRRAPETVGGGQ